MKTKSTTTTHTPGPWYSDTRPDTSIEIQDRVGIPVCVMTLRRDKRDNARLIAASPDLLAALEENLLELRRAYAAAYCGPQPWTEEERENFRVLACKADMNARAAIAKAKGTP